MASWLTAQLKAAEGLLEAVDKTVSRTVGTLGFAEGDADVIGGAVLPANGLQQDSPVAGLSYQPSFTPGPSGLPGYSLAVPTSYNARNGTSGPGTPAAFNVSSAMPPSVWDAPGPGPSTSLGPSSRMPAEDGSGDGSSGGAVGGGFTVKSNAPIPFGSRPTPPPNNTPAAPPAAAYSLTSLSRNSSQSNIPAPPAPSPPAATAAAAAPWPGIAAASTPSPAATAAMGAAAATGSPPPIAVRPAVGATAGSTEGAASSTSTAPAGPAPPGSAAAAKDAGPGVGPASSSARGLDYLTISSTQQPEGPAVDQPLTGAGSSERSPSGARGAPSGAAASDPSSGGPAVAASSRLSVIGEAGSARPHGATPAAATASTPAGSTGSSSDPPSTPSVPQPSTADTAAAMPPAAAAPAPATAQPPSPGPSAGPPAGASSTPAAAAAASAAAATLASATTSAVAHSLSFLNLVLDDPDAPTDTAAAATASSSSSSSAAASQQQIQALSRTCEQLRKRLEASRLENEQLEDMLARAEVRAQQESALVTALREELAAAQQGRVAAEGSLGAQLAVARSSLAEVGERYEASQRAVLVLEGQLAALEESSRRLAEQCSDREGGMVEALGAELVAAESRLAAERKAHQASRAAAASREQSLEQQVAGSTAALQDLTRGLEEANRKSRALEEEVVEATRGRNDLAAQVAALQRQLADAGIEVEGLGPDGAAASSGGGAEGGSGGTPMRSLRGAAAAAAAAAAELEVLRGEVEQHRRAAQAARQAAEASEAQVAALAGELGALRQAAEQRKDTAQLEAQLREVSDMLYLKQTQLERLAAEKAAQQIRTERELESVRQELAKLTRQQGGIGGGLRGIGSSASASASGAPHDVIPMDALGEPYQRLARHTRVGKAVKAAAHFLDSTAATTSFALRQYPLARLVVFCYVALIHLYVYLLIARMQRLATQHEGAVVAPGST